MCISQPCQVPSRPSSTALAQPHGSSGPHRAGMYSFVQPPGSPLRPAPSEPTSQPTPSHRQPTTHATAGHAHPPAAGRGWREPRPSDGTWACLPRAEFYGMLRARESRERCGRGDLGVAGRAEGRSWREVWNWKATTVRMFRDRLASKRTGSVGVCSYVPATSNAICTRHPPASHSSND